MTQVALQTEHVTRTFGAVHAVDDLSLTVPAGMVFGFLGTNGAGKSTTIRLALGLPAPTSGRIAVYARRRAHGARAGTVDTLRAVGAA